MKETKEYPSRLNYLDGIGKIYYVDNFPFDFLEYAPRAFNHRGRPTNHQKDYADVIATFDIETTNLDDIKQSVLWHWQVCIDGFILVGRTWEEFKEALVKIDQSLPKGLTFVFMVHNLSFEWQFLRGIYDFSPEEVFCLTGRKIAKCSMGDRFEFRCSYILTNYSLRQFLESMEVEHQKTELDYSKTRFSWTPIDSETLRYCVVDVLGLYEALRKFYKLNKVNTASCPLTSTSFVRKDFKREMRKGGFIPLVQECAPSYDVYLMIRRAFRGGNTHANRIYTGKILEGITSYDRASSYPDTLVNFPYPIKPFVLDRVTDIKDLLEGFPYLLYIDFENVRLKDPFYGCPYLSIHKLYNLQGAINDNGRLIQARRFQTTVTSVDLRIMEFQYQWDRATIIKAYRSEYGLLPEAVKKVTMDYYKKKTEWKGVDGYEIEYGRAKARLNSIY